MAEKAGIRLGVFRETVDTFPDWTQGLPLRTDLQIASYLLTFLKSIIAISPGLFS